MVKLFFAKPLNITTSHSAVKSFFAYFLEFAHKYAVSNAFQAI